MAAAFRRPFGDGVAMIAVLARNEVFSSPEHYAPFDQDGKL
jgi:hypothetical protein